MINRRPNTQDISWFIDLYRAGKLELNPPYQRKSVWNKSDKQLFLDTIFNNFPSPAIYIQKDQDSNVKYNVVDGKQRLTTIIDFFEDKIALGPESGSLEGKKWTDIKDDNYLRSAFYDYTLTVEQLNSVEDADWNNVFYRLNKNAKSLSRQELRHAQYKGWFINKAELEVKDKIWADLKISTISKARRMKDVEFVSILMLVILEHKIVGFPQSNLDYLYEKYEEKYIEEKIDEETFFDRNSNSIESYNETLVDPLNEAYSVPEIDDEEDFDAELQETKNYILNLLGSISDVFLTPIFTRKRTTHIYSLWTYIVLTPKNERLSSENFALKYKDFIEMLSNVANATPEKIAEYIAEDKRYNFVNEYYDASIGAATEEPQRKARLNALQEFVNQ